VESIKKRFFLNIIDTSDIKAKSVSLTRPERETKKKLMSG
jgi:hypothetical protein